MSKGSDPRSIVTPDAFRVDPPLLGTPLAPPSRRAWALLIDLLVVVGITTATGSVWMVLPTIIGLGLLKAAMKKGVGRFSGVRRFFLGCTGFMVLAIMGIVYAGMAWMRSPEGQEVQAVIDGVQDLDSFGNIDLEGIAGGEFDLEDVLGDIEDGGIGAILDAEQVEEVAYGYASNLQATGLSDEEIEDALDRRVPDEVGETDGEDIIDAVMRRLSGEDAELEDDPAEEAEGPAAIPAEELSLREAMAEYTLWLDTPAEERSRDRGIALHARIQSEVASDTISELSGNIRDLNRDLEAQRRRAEDAEQGFWFWLRGKLDTISLGFGWFTVYFAVLMPLLKGQTVGKKVMGVRVVRLDGQQITWYHAFERAAGYAAGLATGLMGFAQVFWDRNRQAIHDKVAGTVVILEGAQRVPGHWEHVVAQEEHRIATERGEEGLPEPPEAPVDPDPTPE